jgi:hypothetical protein
MVGTPTQYKHFEGLGGLVVGRHENAATFQLTKDWSRTTSWNNLIQNHRPEQDKIRGLMVGRQKMTHGATGNVGGSFRVLCDLAMCPTKSTRPT